MYVFSISLIVFTAILGVGFIIPILPIIAERFGGETFAGIVFSAFAIPRIFLVPIASVLSDRFGRKIFISFGLSIYVVSAIFFAYANSKLEIILARILNGVGSAIAVPVSFAYALDISQAGKEGKIAAIVGASLLLGFGLGPMIGGLITEHFSEKWAFLSMAFMGGFAFLQSLVLKEPQQRKKVGTPFQEYIKTIFLSETYKKAFLIWFFTVIQRSILLSYSPILMKNMGLEESKVGIVFTFYSILSSIAQYSLSGKIDDIKEKILKAYLLGGISSLILTLIYFSNKFGILFIILVISGTLSAMTHPFIVAEVGKESKEKGVVGGSIGFLDLAFSLGSLIGPITFSPFLKFGIKSLFPIVGFTESLIFAIFIIQEKINKNKK